MTLVLTACAAQAAAQPVTSDQTVKALTDLGGQRAVLEQELAIAKLQAQIAEANKTVGHAGGSETAIPEPDAPVVSSVGAVSLPSVVSILGGSDGRLTATLLLPNGEQVMAWPGEGLPNGLTVYDVGARGVRVMQAGNLITLPLAGDDAAPSVGVAPRIAASPIAPPMPLPPGQ